MQPLQVFDMIASRVCAAWPAAELVCYGSMQSSLCTPSSDIDLVVLNAPATPASNLIHTLHEILVGAPGVLSATALAHAQLPLLKLQWCAADGGWPPRNRHETAI